jgi:hypothetical protein
LVPLQFVPLAGDHRSTEAAGHSAFGSRHVIYTTVLAEVLGIAAPALPHDVDPGLGGGAARLTRHSGSSTGNSRRRNCSKREKIAA